jgi:hypothetical protein
MSKLTDEQIDFIIEQVNNSQIETKALREDLVDHFCCVIEDYMKRGISFEASYNKACEVICPNGLDEIHQETIMLLTTKRITIMKKLMFVVGFIGTIFLTTSFMFKALYWPYGGYLLLSAIFILIFILLPLVFLYFYKNEFSTYISYKLKYVFGYIGLALFLTGVVLELLHWPGSEIILILSVFIFNFGFLPFLFYRIHKKFEKKEDPESKTNKFKYIFGVIGVALFLTASVFKLLHYPGPVVLLVSSVFIINFGFLPLLFYQMYKRSMV